MVNRRVLNNKRILHGYNCLCKTPSTRPRSLVGTSCQCRHLLVQARPLPSCKLPAPTLERERPLRWPLLWLAKTSKKATAVFAGATTASQTEVAKEKPESPRSRGDIQLPPTWERLPLNHKSSPRRRSTCRRNLIGCAVKWKPRDKAR